MKKRRIILGSLVVLIVLCCALAWDGLLRFNGFGSVLQCRRKLRDIAAAFDAYRNESEGDWPPRLRALVPYMRDVPSPADWVPMCVGNRQGDCAYGWPYVFRSDVKHTDVEPICWDSQPHRIKGAFFPDIYVRNVLFNDGHVETLSEGKFLRLMQKSGVTEPNTFDPADTLP